ncbi:hypothetical protein M8J75_006057 [Diaphorina citri]|nr:hypothetical protein M8J75_006057 [Diaphorina citri]
MSSADNTLPKPAAMPNLRNNNLQNITNRAPAGGSSVPTEIGLKETLGKLDDLEKVVIEINNYVGKMRASTGKTELTTMLARATELAASIPEVERHVKKLMEDSEPRNRNYKEEDRSMIRGLIEAHGQDSVEVEEIVKMVWPETAYEKVKVIRGNPLMAEDKDNLALIFSDQGKENSGILGIAYRSCGQIEEIITDKKPKDGYQLIEKKISNKIYHRYMATGGEDGSNLMKMIEDIRIRQLRTPGNSNNTAPLGWNINTLNLETLRRIVNNAARQTQFDEFDEEDLSHLAKEICRKAMKKKSNKGRKSAYWWNEDIRDKRQLCTQKRRTYTRNRRRTDETDSMRMYNEYREARKSLNIEIAKSKKKGWLDLCEELKKDIWGLGYKIVRRKVGKKLPILPPEVRETAINKLFPTHPIHVWENTTPRPRLVITIDELVNTAHNMKAKKAPGPDEVPPKIIKEMLREKRTPPRAPTSPPHPE